MDLEALGVKLVSASESCFPRAFTFDLPTRASIGGPKRKAYTVKTVATNKNYTVNEEDYYSLR